MICIKSGGGKYPYDNVSVEATPVANTAMKVDIFQRTPNKMDLSSFENETMKNDRTQQDINKADVSEENEVWRYVKKAKLIRAFTVSGYRGSTL